jgi:hypothetical protein
VALSRVQTVVSYQSVNGGETYTFDVVVGAQGIVTVQNIQGPQGNLCASGLPDVVLDDIQEAKEITLLLLGETEVTSGVITFTGQTEISELLAAGLLNNTEYRVAYTPPDSIQFRTEDKTITSFKAVAGVSYGSVADPKDVAYSVLVSTASTSTTSGTVTFTSASSQIPIVFASAFNTDSYRVLLTVDDFYSARVLSKTRTGFIIEIGISLVGAETAEVGYDVFV